jgi:hypothetical protein
LIHRTFITVFVILVVITKIFFIDKHITASQENNKMQQVVI